MHRFFVETPVGGVGETITLSREESAHASRVLRLRPGEEIRLLDGENLWEAQLVTVDDKETVAAVTALCESPEAPSHAILFQGLPKADKLELIAQKGTELGMWELWPVEMERIAMEAATQSGRAHVPEIVSPLSFAKALPKLESVDLVLIAWEEERALPMSQAVNAYVAEHGVPQSVAIIIGPEGGVSQQEWQQLHDMGAVSVTLGKRILRTETAGLCALSVLWTALGEM